MSENLYELSVELRNVESLMAQDLEEGKTPDEILTKALDEIKGVMSTKVCNIGAWVKNLDADAEAIKAEEVRLHARRKAKENLQESLKAWVLKNIQAGAKFEDSRCVVSTRKSKRVEVTDQAQLDKAYIRTTIVQSVAKDEIQKAIKEGKEVKGAVLVENVSLQVK